MANESVYIRIVDVTIMLSEEKLPMRVQYVWRSFDFTITKAN